MIPTLSPCANIFHMGGKKTPTRSMEKKHVRTVYPIHGGKDSHFDLRT